MSIVVGLRHSWGGWCANVHYSDSSGLTDSLENYLKSMDSKKLPPDTIVNVFEHIEDKGKLEETVEGLLKASQKKQFLNSVLSALPTAIVAGIVSEKYGLLLGTAASLATYLALVYVINDRADSKINELSLRVPKENIFLMQG